LQRRETFDAACKLNEPPNVISKKSKLTRLTAIRHAAWEAYEYLQQEALHMEETLDVTECWTPACDEWQQAVKYNQIRDYQLVVDKLEGLVVQRLFELTKANLSGTGMDIYCHYQS
jgi:hypothetical protein